MVTNDHIEYSAILAQWEKGQEVDGTSLINALAWNRQNQRRALRRLEEACKIWREGSDQKQARIAELEAVQMKEAIYWALGERDDFPPEPEPVGRLRRRYWWRTELRKRSGLPIGGVPAESTPLAPDLSPIDVEMPCDD